MKHDIAIIGGGIVGLASAYRLLQKVPALKLVLLEKESTLAKHQTGNNSGVIHSGVYYTPGSAKAINCVAGYGALLEFCQQEDIPYDLCGKVIVASNTSEIPLLDKIFDRGQQNGLKGIRMISAEEIREKEPHTVGVKGIWVPEAGIIDYKVVAQKLAACIEKAGGTILTGHQVLKLGDDGLLETNKGEFSAKVILNCSGLYSDTIAKMTNPEIDMQIVPFRGEYYVLKPEKSHLVNGLIYPVPDPAFPFLGVHFTKKISGAVEAGPNAVLAFRREGYRKTDFNFKEFKEILGYSGFRKIAAKYWKTGLFEMYRSFSKRAFTKALQKLVPEVQMSDLNPGGAGVRAQALRPDGQLVDDFYFIEKKGIVHVCNAPSPAATSCLAIGETVADKVIAQLDTKPTTLTSTNGNSSVQP